MADPSVEEVDAFLASYKTLAGFLPPWGQPHGCNWSSRWGILDALQIQQAELVFEINAGLTRPTIVALYRKRPIYRVDIVPSGERKENPWGANAVGLPSVVYGPHTHPWEENKGWIGDNGFGEIPFRKPVAIQDVLFIRALEVASRDLNIHVDPAQRECEPPPQASLFAEGFKP